MPLTKLRVVILKPSKYGTDGIVERFRRGFMPNSTVNYLRSMTPDSFENIPIDVQTVDEYVEPDLGYLRSFENGGAETLLALVGVQSHQFHRSLDLAAYALSKGVRHCIIGGPHPMTCDTRPLHGCGVSFALAEAETIWPQILSDAIHGTLAPVYGRDQRWQRVLEAPPLIPPTRRQMRRHVVPMLGIYPARGCPFNCSFCSVIKIAGHRIRSQSLDVTMASLQAAQTAGVRHIMFTSDNFNKYPEAVELLQRMIAERIRLPFFVQCDTQISEEEDFVELLARAGCFQMFVGVESFSRGTLLAARKTQNHPERYREIVRLCRKHRIATHFSNIIGFPADNRSSISEHLDVLCGLAPDCASFYILTPIPGTQQYDEFRAAGLLTEPNMDRYDATCPTWRHPTLRADELRTLLFDCYRRFYSPTLFLSTLRAALRSALRPKAIHPGFIPYVGVPLFTRYFVHRGMHPMSGGVGKLNLDRAADYASLRRSRFGFELAPLPDSLPLSEADAQLNRMGLVG